MPASAPRTRRRGEALEGPILEEAWAEVVEHGWDGFSVARVAARAGASKSSVYARWRGKGPLIFAAAVRYSATRSGRAIVSDSLHDNLASLALSASEFLQGPYGSVMRAVASLQTPLEELREFTGPIFALSEIFDDARARGELGPNPIPAQVAFCGLSLVNYHYLFTGSVLSDAEIGQLVAGIWVPALVSASRANTVE